MSKDKDLFGMSGESTPSDAEGVADSGAGGASSGDDFAALLDELQQRLSVLASDPDAAPAIEQEETTADVGEDIPADAEGDAAAIKAQEVPALEQDDVDIAPAAWQDEEAEDSEVPEAEEVDMTPVEDEWPQSPTEDEVADVPEAEEVSYEPSEAAVEAYDDADDTFAQQSAEVPEAQENGDAPEEESMEESINNLNSLNSMRAEPERPAESNEPIRAEVPAEAPVVAVAVAEVSAPRQGDGEPEAVPATRDAGGLAPDYKERYMRHEREGFAGGFRLAAGETVLSMYRLFKNGRVYMTNRRLLIESSMHTDLPIARVAGFTVGKFARVRVLRLIFSLIFMGICAGVAVAFTLPQLLSNWSVFADMSWLKYVLYGVGGVFGLVGFIMFCGCFPKRFILSIFTEGVQQTVSVRSTVGRGDVDIFQAIAYGSAGPDYKLFAANAGARLIDIKRTYYGRKRSE